MMASEEYPDEFLSLFSQIAMPGHCEGCWLWPNGAWAAGYGRFSALGLQGYVHRISYHVHHGPVPSGLVVRHHCDIKLCWNPEHLAVGSPADNVNDAASRDRLRFGTQHPHHRLTEEQVRALFREFHYDGVKIAVLKERYGIRSSATISRIVNRKMWRRATEGIASPSVPINRYIGNAKTRLSPEQAAEVKRRAASGSTHKALAGEFGVSQTTIGRAVHRR